MLLTLMKLIYQIIKWLFLGTTKHNSHQRRKHSRSCYHQCSRPSQDMRIFKTKWFRHFNRPQRHYFRPLPLMQSFPKDKTSSVWLPTRWHWWSTKASSIPRPQSTYIRERQYQPGLARVEKCVFGRGIEICADKNTTRSKPSPLDEQYNTSLHQEEKLHKNEN